MSLFLWRGVVSPRPLPKPKNDSLSPVCGRLFVIRVFANSHHTGSGLLTLRRSAVSGRKSYILIMIFSLSVDILITRLRNMPTLRDFSNVAACIYDI